jgi:hypothetical protein
MAEGAIEGIAEDYPCVGLCGLAPAEHWRSHCTIEAPAFCCGAGIRFVVCTGVSVYDRHDDTGASTVEAAAAFCFGTGMRGS